MYAFTKYLKVFNAYLPPSFIKKLPAMEQGVYSFVYEITSVAEASSVVCSTGVSSVCVAFANEPTY